MIKAIVYSSQTGSTAEYAKILSEQIELPVYTLDEAAEKLEKKSEIIYMGWLMASTVKGYKKAKKLFQVEALVGVGISPAGQQVEVVQTAENLKPELPLFTLQGAFHLDQLKGVDRFLMSGIRKNYMKRLSKIPERTPEEENLLDLMTNGGSRVCPENLSGVIEWYRQR